MDERDTLAAAQELLRAISDGMPPFPDDSSQMTLMEAECFSRLSAVCAVAEVLGRPAQDHTATSMRMEADYLAAMWRRPLRYRPEPGRAAS